MVSVTALQIWECILYLKIINYVILTDNTNFWLSTQISDCQQNYLLLLTCLAFHKKLNHLTSPLNNVETCVISKITQNLYFGFCRTFQPNKCVRDDDNRNWPITNEQFKSQLNSRSCKYGGPLLEVAVSMGLICQWIQTHGRSGMNTD